MKFHLPKDWSYAVGTLVLCATLSGLVLWIWMIAVQTLFAPRRNAPIRFHDSFTFHATAETVAWTWGWNSRTCAGRWHRWLQTRAWDRPIRRLHLRLVDLPTDASVLPFHATYTSPHRMSISRAGAQCYLEAGWFADALDCQVAPLAMDSPSGLATAATAAVGQAAAAAMQEVFSTQAMATWTWTQWDPVVAPDANATTESGEWRSACSDIRPG